MRNHHHLLLHHKLLLSLASLNCLIIFDTLLLNAQLTGDGAKACYASTSDECQLLKSNHTFPFLTAQQCGAKSGVVITGCSSANEHPIWPDFNNLTSGYANTPDPLSPPAVMTFYNPPYTPQSAANQTQHLDTNSSHHFSQLRNPEYGFINIGWNMTLINSTEACKSRASLDQISYYVPNSISLEPIAHSAFSFNTSNIILLFDCNSTSVGSSTYRDVLQENTNACKAYETDCNLEEKDHNCYQYIPYKNLSLYYAMESLDCKLAMFFYVLDAPLNVSNWIPGLLQLNWSTTGTGWLPSTIKTCAGCLQTNGTCGYDSNDQFQCFCANNQNFSTNCTSNDKSECNKHFGCAIRLKVIIGVVVVALSISLSLLALFCFCKRKKSSAKSYVPCSSPHSNKFWMKRPSFLSRKQDPILAKEIPYQELVYATESFAQKHMLGDGGFGAVYKGVLADGSKVAVKRLHHDNYRRMEHFYNEIKVLSNLDHPNLVRLYGFCCEDERELLLVFEYARQGTVSDQLHNASNPPMPWKLRLDIACETAAALSYLHNSVTPPIYHRDVKTTNILLDEGFHAKLADFGLSKLVPLKGTHVSTAPQGTPGYLDPEYHQCYQLTDKSDVYSLGVVLMELISAKLAVDLSREKGEINLSTLAVMKIKCGLSEELVDPALEMKKNPSTEKSIKRVIELSFQCLHGESDERPSMSYVAETLAKIRRDHAGGHEEVLLSSHGSNHNTHSTHIITCQSLVTEHPSKPSQQPHHSPHSVLFYSGSSYPSSNLSSS